LSMVSMMNRQPTAGHRGICALAASYHVRVTSDPQVDEVLATALGHVRGTGRVVVVGPGGIGKSTLVARLVEELAPDHWVRRPPAQRARLPHLGHRRCARPSGHHPHPDRCTRRRPPRTRRALHRETHRFPPLHRTQSWFTDVLVHGWYMNALLDLTTVGGQMEILELGQSRARCCDRTVAPSSSQLGQRR
jgi:hypothetical protein